MRFPTASGALVICTLFAWDAVRGAVPGPSGPDSSGTAAAASSLDGSAASASDPSSPSSLPSTHNSGISSSSGSTVFGSGGSSPGSSGIPLTQSSVSYDVKSLDNPHWVSFLNELATQTNQELASLQANAVNDPSIAIMWDVYVQTIGDAAGLPSGGRGSATSQGTGGSTGTSMFGKSSQTDGGGAVSSPGGSNNWFQSFFRDPADVAKGNQMLNTYMGSQPSTSYNSGNNFGTSSSGASTGPVFNTQPSYSPPQNKYSMDQMFAQFHLPSASQQYQTPQQQYQQPATQYRYQQPQTSPQQSSAGTNSMNFNQHVMSLVSPILSSLTGQNQQSVNQQSGNQQWGQNSSPQSGQGYVSPDAAWGAVSYQSSSTPQQPPFSLDNATMKQLGDQLFMLLGKTPLPLDYSNIASQSVQSYQPPPSTQNQQQPQLYQPQFNTQNQQQTQPYQPPPSTQIQQQTQPSQPQPSTQNQQQTQSSQPQPSTQNQQQTQPSQPSTQNQPQTQPSQSSTQNQQQTQPSQPTTQNQQQTQPSQPTTQNQQQTQPSQPTTQNQQQTQPSQSQPSSQNQQQTQSSQTQFNAQGQEPPLPSLILPNIPSQTQTSAQTSGTNPGVPVFKTGFFNTPTNQVLSGLNGFNLGNTPSLGSQGSLPQTEVTMPIQLPPRRSVSGLSLLKPVVNFYNAGFNTRASRDLGCRTLGELFDMDVPRPLDFTCNRICPAVMPGAATGKRFGLSCLCCPAFVSDTAIGMRSMYRQAESLA